MNGLGRRITLLGISWVLTASTTSPISYARQSSVGVPAPHLASRCVGTRLIIARPAVQIRSPQQFAASGGTLVSSMVRQASHLPHLEYWVLPRRAVVVDTCAFVSITEVEIGINDRRQTELHVFSVVPFGQSSQPTLVGSLLIPTGGGCAPHPTSTPIKAPDGRPVAQFSRVPGGFSSSIGVTFPPCSVSRRPSRPVPTPSPGNEISFRILSQVQYSGTDGTLIVVTARPSPAARRPGLNLGARTGTLPDGTPLWSLQRNIRWVKRGLIISLSGPLSITRLKALAADIVA